MISQAWRRISSLIFIEQEISTVDRWALRNSNKCSPDELIVAAVIKSFATDPKDWTFSGALDYPLHYVGYNSQNAGLTNKNKKIVITFIFEGYDFKDKGRSCAQAKYRACGCSVNGIKLSPSAFRMILRAWEGVSAKIKAVESAAAKAKSEMERNEKAWEIAESLLGMKRNEYGALIPVKSVEEVE